MSRAAVTPGNNDKVHVVQTAIACAKEGATLAHALREREQRGGGPRQRPRGGCRAASFPEAPWHQIQQHVSATFSTRSHGNARPMTTTCVSSSCPPPSAPAATATSEARCAWSSWRLCPPP